MLECVINISEGRRPSVIASIAAAAGSDLLDVHHDPDHHRSVLTVIGTRAPREVTRCAVEHLDLTPHTGVHPRLGVVDVVPFVPLGGATMADAIRARDDFSRWAAEELDVPCFRYGPERPLPEVRRRAWVDLAPDVGPATPHPTAGAICVGARPVLVAYNVWLADADVATARSIASLVRGPAVRALGFAVGRHTQVSMNLIDPERVGPDRVYDAVASQARVERAELVGLLPEDVLRAVPLSRWAELDLGPERTIEARLARRERGR